MDYKPFSGDRARGKGAWQGWLRDSHSLRYECSLVTYLVSLVLLLWAVSSFGTSITIYNSSSVQSWSYTFGWDEYNSGGGLTWDFNTPQFSLTLTPLASQTYTWPSEAVGIGLWNGSAFTPEAGYATSSGSYILPQPTVSLYLGIGAGAENQFTNYSYCLNNPYGVPATATWTFDGAVMKSETLGSGASDCWVTPPVETSPVAQNFTVSTSVIQQTATVNYNSNGVPSFGTPAGGGATVTGDGSTNPIVYNNASGSNNGSNNTATPGGSSVTTPSTNILYSTPAGSASESTLEAVGNVLHSDLQQIQAGQNILNNSVVSGFYTVTNELGQLVTYAYSNVVASDGILIALTNLTKAVETNGAETNTVVVTSATNSSLVLTNYALNSTLVGISNLLGASGPTNLSGFTGNGVFAGASNLMASSIPATATNASAATNAYFAVVNRGWYDNLMAVLTPNLPPASTSSPSTLSFTAFGYVLNFDPAYQFPQVGQFALWGWTILLSLAYLYSVGKLYLKIVLAAGAVNTGKVPDLEVSGGVGAFTAMFDVGGNFLGTLVAVIVPAVFLALYAAMITVFTGEAFGVLNLTGIFDFSAFPSKMGATAYYLFTSFFPLPYFLSLVCSRIILQFTMGFAFSTFAGAARYLWG